MSEFILITGADGYFGNLLVRNYLDRTDKKLKLWVRASGNEEYESKLARLEKAYGANLERIQFYHGDLSENRPFREVGRESITGIVHTAAITRFNVEEDLANRVNRDGVRKVAEFARQCPDLQQFGFVSTVYSSGLTKGIVPETSVKPEGRFANHYERSKWEAEHIIQTEFADLPWNIYRAATIIADNESGEVVQFNVFHNTMRLFFHGLISLMPGERDIPIYLTTGKSTASAIFHLMEEKFTSHEIYNICYDRQNALTLGELVDRVFSNFQSSAEFRKKRIMQPLFTDLEAFESLASVLTGVSGMVVKQALDSIRPFSKQLYIEKNISNGNLLKHYPEYPSPDMAVLLDKVIQFLMREKWGINTGLQTQGGLSARV
ncbi:MAG: SDR family oxidoreductase [Burkholderiales bacterium]|nr:SDR family oxidoreductase [Burkholderiales bacterium]MDR4517398.1 SDR family oxidoreductase [Nitrosomonas sp.]